MQAVSPFVAMLALAAILTVATGETTSREFFEEIPSESLMGGNDLKAAIGAADKGSVVKGMHKIVRKLTHKPKSWIKHKILKSARKIQGLFPKLHLKGAMHKIAKTTKVKKSKLKSKRKAPRNFKWKGYTWQDARITHGGHYKLGAGRRRIGSGFGRRRRTVPKHKRKKKVFHRLLDHIIKVRPLNCKKCIKAFLKSGGCNAILYRGKRAKDFMPRKIGDTFCSECAVPAAKHCHLKKIMRRHTPHRRRRRAQVPRKYIDLSKKKFSGGKAVECKSFMLRTQTGKVPRAATTSMPKVTLIGTKGSFKGLLQTGRKGKVEVTTLVTGHIGALVEVRLQATSEDGWYFTRFETRACDFTVDVNPGPSFPGTKWQDFGCTHRWLDGRPYNDEPSLYKAPYADRIVLRRVNSECSEAERMRKAAMKARELKSKNAHKKKKGKKKKGKKKKGKTKSGKKTGKGSKKSSKKSKGKKKLKKSAKKKGKKSGKGKKPAKKDGDNLKDRSANAKANLREARRKYLLALKKHAKRQVVKNLSQKLKAAARVAKSWHIKERLFKSKEARYKWHHRSEGVKAAAWADRKNKGKMKRKRVAPKKPLSRWDVYKKAKRNLSPRRYAWLKRESFRASEKMWKARVARKKRDEGTPVSNRFKMMRRLITATAEMRSKAREARMQKGRAKGKKTKRAVKTKHATNKNTKAKKTKKATAGKKAKTAQVTRAAIAVTKAENAVMVSSKKMVQAHEAAVHSPEPRKLAELKAQVAAAKSFVNTAKALVKKAKTYALQKQKAMRKEESAVDELETEQ